MFIPLASAWLVATGLGMQTLLVYANTPGPIAVHPQQWPAKTPLASMQGRKTLIMFAHPQCPCSRASIQELARVLAKSPDQPETAVVFYYPSANGEGWAHTDLWSSAAAIPGVRAIADRDGTVARQFGASTSGQVLLYKSGQLVFKGGITAARGHQGSNDGSDSLLALLSSPSDSSRIVDKRRDTPVYGCSLATAH